MSLDTPVALFVYNRPDFAERVFEKIRAAKPAVFILVSDGPKDNGDLIGVVKCRELVQRVDWPCEIKTIFADTNLGCKRRFFSALNKIFEENDRLIILEDDCIPTPDFFTFCEWGLKTFEAVDEISIISGSNFGEASKYRNGFSRYMNCWGWATWRSKWNEVNPYLGVHGLRAMQKMMARTGFVTWERLYWTEVMKHSIFSSSIWDFYVQETMLRLDKYSVFPGSNLVENVGFDSRSTHTRGNRPGYVERTSPEAIDILSKEPNFTMLPSWERDRSVAEEIWSCRQSMAYRLKLTNLYRYNSI